MHNRPSAAEPREGIKEALKRFERGDQTGAANICTQIGAGAPDYAAAQHLLGVIAYGRNDFQSAQQLLLRATAENPFDPAYQSDLGLVYMARQEYTQALACFIRSLTLDPGRITACNNGGLALLALKRPDEALDWFRQALALAPNFVPAFLNQGIAHRDRNDPAQARKSFEAALAIEPGYAKAHFFLGDLSQCEKDWEAAIRHFREAIRAKPDYLAAHNRLGICLAENNRFDEALACLSLAAQQFPASAETFCNYGNILRKAHAFDEALERYRQAIELKPEWVEAHFNIGLIHLLLGNFQEGWPEFEWRLRQFPPESGYPNRHGLPLWQGEPLQGKTILVYDEQGFGDVFLFMRYLPHLKKAGARVVLETRPALLSIFSAWPHVDEVVARHPRLRPASVCDYCLPLASLPSRMGTHLATIPADVPYIIPEPTLKERWARRMAKGAFKIGVVWSGSVIDTTRGVDLELLAPLSAMRDIGIYGLQKQTESVQAGSIANYPWLDNLGPEFNDFSDTAGAIANCDLILTIDTAVAHLAGAMAATVWVLVPHVPDWRWFLDRDDSPWYPTMRLFRQHQPGQWTLPICEALAALKRLVAEKLNPHHLHSKSADRGAAEGCFTQAQSFQAHGRLDEAIDAYEQAVASDPLFVEAHYNLGVLCYQQGRWSEAANAFSDALACMPNFAQAAFNLAMAYEKCDHPSAAVSAYRQTLAIQPAFAAAAYNLGLLLFNQGQHTGAITAFGQAVASDTNHFDAYNNLGLACHHAGRLDEAQAAFEAAIRLKPDFVKAYHNLGNLFMDLGQWDKTITQYQHALEFIRHDPMAHYAMGKLYLELPDLDHARRCFETAIALRPEYADAHFELAQILLRQENYLQGWKCFEKRFQCTNSKSCIYPFALNLPIWDGSTFEHRTLFVHCEQGLGDTIQFARFLPLVKKMGGKVIFQVQPVLMPLFKDFKGIDQLLPLTERKPDDFQADTVIPLMSLPGCLKVTADQIPNRIPYLSAQIIEKERWKAVVNPRTFNVGVVWSGNPMQVNDSRRSCHPDDFLCLSKLPGIQIYSLQKNSAPFENAHILKSGAAIPFGDRLETFGDTAALIANLDLTITVDTSVAHLAGAMGCPVWILLCHLPDWRWGLHRTDSVWYPTARLFRQSQKGAWGPVFEMVRKALEEILAAGHTVLS